MHFYMPLKSKLTYCIVQLYHEFNSCRDVLSQEFAASVVMGFMAANTDFFHVFIYPSDELH